MHREKILKDKSFCDENLKVLYKKTSHEVEKILPRSRTSVTRAQVHDLLPRHAHTETCGECSQIHVMSAENTYSPWKLCCFALFPIYIFEKICSHFLKYFLCPVGSSTVLNKNSKFKTEVRSTGKSLALPGHFLFQ